MKSFLKVSTFLVVALFLMVSGVNIGLERLQQEPVQNSYTFYDEKGNVVMVYNGDLAYCPAYTKPASVVPHGFLHRIRTSTVVTPVSS